MVAAGVVPLQSSYLVMSLVQMSIVPWKVVQKMGVYGYTCLLQVGVDPGMMTWARLMGNLVPWDSFALVRHSQLVGIDWVGLPE